MKIPIEQKQAYSFKDPIKRKIFDELERNVGQGTAAFFMDACKIMENQPPLSSQTHLVAHLLREIDSSIRDVMIPFDYKSPKQDVYKDQINKIVEQYVIDTDIIKLWLKMGKLHKRAHRSSLDMPRVIDNKFIELWVGSQILLDNLLNKISENYARYIKYIDDLLEKPQISPGDIKKLKSHLPNNTVTLGYLFDKLEDPACLPILRSKGFFSNPLNALMHPEGGVSHPYWPQVGYLLRMSKIVSAQKEVKDICLSIETTNIRIRSSIVEIACNLPIEFSLKIAKKTEGWIETSDRWLLPEKIGNLISYLAINGKSDNALTLTKKLLSINPDQKYKKEVKKDKYTLPPDPATYIDDYQYEEILNKNIPDLVKHTKSGAIILLTDLLCDAIKFSMIKPDKNRPEDFSYIWQPAIEDHSQNNNHGLKTLILKSLRNSCEALIKEDSTQKDKIINILRNHDWKVFDRLELHLLCLFPDNSEGEIRTKLLDQKYFEDLTFEHEYFLLAKDKCNLISKKEQEKLLQIITSNPSYLNKLRRNLETQKLSDIPNLIERYKKIWRQNHLIPFINCSPKFQNMYDDITREIGKPKHPEFKAYSSGGSFGPNSPKKNDEIQKMTIEEIIEFLQKWKPPKDRFEASREGLGRELTLVVESDPNKYASEAVKFKDLDPTYIRSILSGFKDAVKNNKRIVWNPILDLCMWVVEQPKTIPNRQSTSLFGEDPDWDWCVNTIVEFLSESLKKRSSQIPAKYRKKVWSIIEIVCVDPNPSEEDEKKRGDDFDPINLSINSTRPEALFAAIEYGIWIKRMEEKEHGTAKIKTIGFKSIPELKQTLEDHLDLRKDSSLAIRSVYGQSLSRIIFLDSEWTRDNLLKIFPKEKIVYCDVAWKAYIEFNNPYNEVLDIIESEMDFYIEKIGKDIKFKSHSPVSAEDRLAQHLMAYYWNGKLNLKSKLIENFYEHANDECAAKAMASLGRGLKDTSKPSSAILDRLTILWIKRLANAKKDPVSHQKELAEFSWWFISKKYDDKWSIIQLETILRLGVDIEAEHMVSERLAEVSAKFPLQTIKCIQLIIENDKKGWFIISSRDEIKKIVENGLFSQSSKANKESTKLLNRLISLGHMDFRDLLP